MSRPSPFVKCEINFQLLITLNFINVLRYYTRVAIKNFKTREAQKIFEGQISQKLPHQIQRKARMKLIQIDSAAVLEDLRLPPSNRLHALDRDRDGQHSISINMQYRICFEWKDGNAYEVEITDYH
ncbi:MAG TPA: type II toxin-antitoxin system RelE/ParE family toxin [Xanthomonadales bacterium]|nr:type II toxin-antitoxin system RelE/ParE family toxin [Xanthomonadales bacterium]